MKPIMTLALLPLLFSMAPLSASGQDRTINGQPVTGGEVAAVQDRCKELQAQQGTTGTQEPETTIDDTNADQTTQDNLSSAEGAIDLRSITLEQCQAGGFTDQTGND
jgi:hypothetical protein